jgi:F-type H+-transporting ATPase subunit delta
VASEKSDLAGLADRYATALYELADEAKALDTVADDLRSLRTMIAGSADLRRLLRSPVLARADQAKAITALATHAKLSPLVVKFLGLAAQNRRLFALGAMIDAYLAELAHRRGEMAARVTAAHKLTDAQTAALTEALRKVVGGKVAVEVTTDPSLIGGMVVKVGSRLFDTSLKTKLARLQLAMKGIG